MKKILKRIIFVSVMLMETVFVFSQSEEYLSALQKAKNFEAQKKWAYALGAYYDAVLCSDAPELKVEAYDSYNRIANEIISGKPGIGKFNAFSLHDEWKNLLLNAEKYGTEYGRWSYRIAPLEEGDLNYTTRTATYTSSIILEDSDRYRKVIGVIQQGYKNAYRADWTDLPKSNEDDYSYAWPIMSASSPVGTNFKPDDAAVFVRAVNAYSEPVNWNAFALYNIRINDSKGYTTGSTLYDLKLTLADSTGKKYTSDVRVLLNGTKNNNDRSYYWDDYTSQLWNQTHYDYYLGKNVQNKGASLGTGISFQNISPDLMELIDNGEVKIVPVALYLEYGKYVASDDIGGRKFIKSFPETSIALSKVNFLGLYDQEPGLKAFEEVKLYKDASESIALIKKFYDFIKVKGSDSVYSFDMSAVEIPQVIFEEVMGYNKSKVPNAYGPVTNVNWFEAAAFCNKLSVLKGLTPCYSISQSTDPDKWGELSTNTPVTINFDANGYRLPTVEEWMYALDGGQQKVPYLTNDNILDIAWIQENSNDEPNYVGKKLPNVLGLFDMIGNVREWTTDFDGNYSAYHVGKSYNNSMKYFADVDYKAYDLKKDSYDNVGFRIVISRKAEEEKKLYASSFKLCDSYTDLVRIPGSGNISTFSIAKIEVPQVLFQEIMGFNPSELNSGSFPVTNVSWYDAIVFCNKLSVRDGYTPCYSYDGNTDVSSWPYVPGKFSGDYYKLDCNNIADGYRLPTTEEWTYAAKCGTENTPYAYSGSNSAIEVGWYKANSQDSAGKSKIHSAGLLKPNAIGLYDMTGNVWEWCQDRKSDNRYNLGGGYLSSDPVLSKQDNNSANGKYEDCGFRVIRSEYGIEKEAVLNRSKELVENFNDFAFLNEVSLYVSKTEVPQAVFEQVMNYNKSSVKGSCYPVTNVSWYDAIYFCNAYSVANGLTPCYEVNGSYDVKEWNYVPGNGDTLAGEIICHAENKGYRLPTRQEWIKFSYVSNDFNASAWYEKTSLDVFRGVRTIKEVGLLTASPYGLYDMHGNVWEWVNDNYSSTSSYYIGGCVSSYADTCKGSGDYNSSNKQYETVGFRIVRSN